MVELLAPAGDLEKLKIALIYGADAVFVGGQNFSLRARASNFTIEDIKQACEFAHNLGKKVYITTNIIPHNEDLEGLLEYLQALESANVDAIITASPAIIDVALKQTGLEVHLSTQQSAMNAATVDFWQAQGVTRVVLARELTLGEIDLIKKNSDAELEVFIHGGMCMSYSGRCSLSDNMTNRDANRGGCAHSCRWIYSLIEDSDAKEENFSMSSKDLQALRQTTRLIDAGVSSLKIEGRMKSLHYIATVVKTYRLLIDEYLKYGKINDYSIYEEMISKAENRETSHGFLEGKPGLEQQLYVDDKSTPSQIFLGLVNNYNEANKMLEIEQRNYFTIGEEIEIFSPNSDITYFTINEMFDEKGEQLEVARHPKQKVFIKYPNKVEASSMIRRKE